MIVSCGDLVKSQKGRDSQECFLVIKIEGEFAYIVDGKIHKYQSPKKKNIKHLKVVKTHALLSVAERINKGETIGNAKLAKLIKAEILGG